jgi:hypothetical protein
MIVFLFVQSSWCAFSESVTHNTFHGINKSTTYRFVVYIKAWQKISWVDYQKGWSGGSL